MSSEFDEADQEEIDHHWQPPSSGPTSFDFDDAFSDGDDHDLTYEFSSNAIREDLARNIPSAETHWVGADRAPDMSTTNGVSEPQDTSVSTLDNSNEFRGSQSGSSHSSPAQSPDDSELSSRFSQISLSEGPAQGHWHAYDHDAEPETKLSLPRLDEQSVSLPDLSHFDENQNEPEFEVENHIPYPHVIIDASEPSSRQVESKSSRPPSLKLNKDISPSNNGSHTPVTSHSAPLSGTFPPENAASSSSPSLPSPPLTEVPTPKTRGHRPTRSVGPSVFEQVMSKTRPSFLPPKTRQEDDKHMADWQSMMRLSRAAAEKKRKALNERRLAREKKIEDSIHLWEKEIIPDWKVVNRSPALRKIWWSGIPTKLRATMWERAVGNALALSKALLARIR